MTVTLAQIQNEVYELIGKSATTYGFLTPTKINLLINDAMQFVSSEMIGANATWLNKQAFLNITANSATIPLPSDLAIVNWVKKLVTDHYTPITYSENAEFTTDTTPASTAQYIPTWRFMTGKLALEPTPGVTQASGILIDYIAYPTNLALAVDLDVQLEGPPFLQLIKWHTAEMAWQLTSESGATPPPWAPQVTKWYNACRKIIAKRNARPTIITGFTNY